MIVLVIYVVVNYCKLVKCCVYVKVNEQQYVMYFEQWRIKNEWMIDNKNFDFEVGIIF